MTAPTAQPSEERDPLTYAIIGAAIAVHRELGNGFLETVYQEALAIELQQRGIPFIREHKLSIYYKGRPLQTFYKADFLCDNQVILELKAQKNLSGTEEAQLIHYLKATGIPKGLLLNFGTPSLAYKRFVF